MFKLGKADRASGMGKSTVLTVTALDNWALATSKKYQENELGNFN